MTLVIKLTVPIKENIKVMVFPRARNKQANTSRLNYDDKWITKAFNEHLLNNVMNYWTTFELFNKKQFKKYNPTT